MSGRVDPPPLFGFSSLFAWGLAGAIRLGVFFSLACLGDVALNGGCQHFCVS